MIGLRNSQLRDPTAEQVWLDAEGTFSPSWAESLGIDLSKVAVIPPSDAQDGKECFEFLLGIPKEDPKTHLLIGKKKPGLIDDIARKELNVNFVVYDSLGALIPPQELVADVGKQNIALLSRFLTKEMKRLTGEVHRSKIPFVFINHKKTNIDPWASSDRSFSGGNSYIHFLSVNIYVEAIMRKDATIFDDKEQKIGHKMRATVEKTKFGSWPKKCEFDVNFNIGIVNIHEELINVAMNYDIITKPTSMSYEFNEQKWVGMPKLLEAVKDSQLLQDQLRAEIEKAWDKRYEKKVKPKSDVESEDGKISKKKKKGDEK